MTGLARVLRTSTVAVIVTQLACAARAPGEPTKATAPTVSSELPDAPWVAVRLEEVALFNALRGAEPLARVDMPAGESELRIYLHSGPRRPMIQIHRGPAGVRGEMWLWWWAGGQEDAPMFAELNDWVTCGDRRKRGDWGACRPEPRAPVDWAAMLTRLTALRVWDLPGHSRFVKAIDDHQMVLVETRDGPHYRMYLWDVAWPLETGPGVAASAAATGLWETVWEIVSTAEHPQ